MKKMLFGIIFFLLSQESYSLNVYEPVLAYPFAERVALSEKCADAILVGLSQQSSTLGNIFKHIPEAARLRKLQDLKKNSDLRLYKIKIDGALKVSSRYVFKSSSAVLFGSSTHGVGYEYYSYRGDVQIQGDSCLVRNIRHMKTVGESLQ